jgi:hypothetical protein
MLICTCCDADLMLQHVKIAENLNVFYSPVGSMGQVRWQNNGRPSVCSPSRNAVAMHAPLLLLCWLEAAGSKSCRATPALGRCTITADDVCNLPQRKSRRSPLAICVYRSRHDILALHYYLIRTAGVAYVAAVQKGLNVVPWVRCAQDVGGGSSDGGSPPAQVEETASGSAVLQVRLSCCATAGQVLDGWLQPAGLMRIALRVMCHAAHMLRVCTVAGISQGASQHQAICLKMLFCKTLLFVVACRAQQAAHLLLAWLTSRECHMRQPCR